MGAAGGGKGPEQSVGEWCHSVTEFVPTRISFGIKCNNSAKRKSADGTFPHCQIGHLRTASDIVGPSRLPAGSHTLAEAPVDHHASHFGDRRQPHSPDRLDERPVVSLVLIGVINRELTGRVVEHGTRNHVARDFLGVGRPCMCLRPHPPAQFGVTEQKLSTRPPLTCMRRTRAGTSKERSRPVQPRKRSRLVLHLCVSMSVQACAKSVPILAEELKRSE
jgi:hypothetical protein